MFNPVSTYRIQFHKDFNFEQFQSCMDYLRDLGVQTIYASPIFTATPGSNHGYDGFNPHEINPEIGNLDQLREISRRLKIEGMNWLQDIVPNHMAFDPRNPWLRDVLRNGKDSPYAKYFDIDWNYDFTEGKLMLPFLGQELDKVIRDGKLKLGWQDEEICLSYFESHFPVNPSTQEKLKEGEQDIPSILETVNADKEKLKEIAYSQHYLLCHWQQTDQQINYRRFFTVNGLICLNIQDEEVFQDFHAFIHQLVKEGIFNGLRIDHIDGLFDPANYASRLKSLVGESVFVTVEKILHHDENLPSYWQVEGNTGYDFLAMVNNLLTWKEQEDILKQLYTSISGQFKSFDQQLRDKKSLILYQHMQGELDNLFQLFINSELADEQSLQSTSLHQIKKAIADFLIYFPVYRFYSNSLPLMENESRELAKIFSRIKQSETDNTAATALLEATILHHPQQADESFRERALYFFQRCMQFTGPLMAKGFEDTLLYNYYFSLSHNEVGDSPDVHGYTIDSFHHKMLERQKHWPLSMNATATHDTKRGEDVRARLNVISEKAVEWTEAVENWREMNKAFRTGKGPDANDEYFIYQTLVGHFPMVEDEMAAFPERLEEYIRKALRESKTHSNWTNPDEDYEAGCIAFVKAILHPTHSFRGSLVSFVKKIADHGLINSLTQLMLKFCCPGVTDTYQGTELWDWSFVDPDNRRPVDYEKRKNYLESFSSSSPSELIRELWNDRSSGRIKLWMTQQFMLARKRHSQLFTEGDYLPLEIKGKYARHVMAFARKHRQTMMLVVVPLFTSIITDEQQCELTEIDWKDTAIILPQGVLPEARSILQDQSIMLGSVLPLKQALGFLPFALIQANLRANDRAAGLLLHLSSLPSAFGIGDMGPEARQFADLLYRTHQKYWQLLPLNPTEAGQGHSPYSATSSRAGNILLVSPDDLLANNWLKPEDLNKLPQTGNTDFEAVLTLKTEMLDKAWNRFIESEDPALHEFNAFCSREAYWLEDFSLFSLLKSLHGGHPWYEWPDDYKLRNENALDKLKEDHAQTLQKIQWFQFVFDRQWKALKTYCNQKGIQLIGDIPFYVSYDSADVWAARHYFKLDEMGQRRGVAGVPPDAFSADGQLWGMPVFKWNELKKDGYQWWVERLRKNLELFDIVRLDHFRAFSAYWEVSAKEPTAKKGKWIKGPGMHFFREMKKVFGELPFIAEDLGEIDEPVYQLRDRFQLPGMKVLQFAFGDDLGVSPHAPHNHTENFIVYTGTHDNNTTRGWWRQEGESARSFLEEYAGRNLHEDEVPFYLCRMAYASVASIVILPVQDLLGLDEIARMNQPSSVQGNWTWRLLPGQINEEAERKLKHWTRLYNRR